MKICYVCSEYPPGPHGGIGTMVQLLARSLAAAGHDVRVIGICDRSYPAPDIEEDRGVRIWRLREPGGRFGWIRGRRALYHAVARWSCAGEIDLLEVPDWGGWAAGWPRRIPVPVVARLNGSLSYFQAELGRTPRRTTYWLEYASLHRVDAWCSVSQYTADRTRDVFHLHSSASDILHNPTEPPGATPSFEARCRTQVVFTGTLTWKKGVVSLIDAWPAVHAAVPDAELHLYGKDGRTEGNTSMRAYLVKRLPIELRPSVCFHGHVDREKILSVLATARAAVFPSYTEACALAPIEALAMGCPVIHTRLSSGPEVIRDGLDGILVDPRCPAELSTAVIRLLRDETLARRFSQAGPSSARERFSLEHMLERNVAFYERCLIDFHASRGRP